MITPESPVDTGGLCEKSVVKCPEPWPLVFLILNIILPGWGTMMSSYCDKEGLNTDALIIGFLQFLTAFIIIGWIWSIVWGVRIWTKSAI